MFEKYLIWMRKNYLYLGIGLIAISLPFVLVACNQPAEEVEIKEYIPAVKTVLVSPGISSEIQTTGEIQAQKSATLTSEVKADVAKVLVKNGDSVVANQILITLDSASVKTSVSTAQSAYYNASSGLTQTGLSVEKNIEAAQIALTTAEINLANTLTQNAASRNQAEETLNAAKISSSLSTSSAQTSLDNAISSSFPTAQNAITKCDEIMGVSEVYKYSNDSFEDLLGALKTTTKSAASTSISAALNALLINPNDYSSARSLLQKAEAATIATLDVLNNSTTGTALTQTTLSGYITSINTQLSTVRGIISTLDSAKSALESAEQNSNGESQSVISAQAAYNSSIAQINAGEESAKRAVESARVALDSAKRGAALNKVTAKTSLDAALGSLQQARISADKLTIRAPFTGKVSGISVEIGDEVSVGNTLLTVEDPSNLKIVAYLSGDEVRKVSLGDEVKIATQSKDNITSISPSADPITKKYKVEVYHQNPYLHSGEFVKLRFQIGESNSVDNRIFLPITAINILANENFVWGVEKNEDNSSTLLTKIPVILGELEGDFVEILNGVEIEDEVVVEGGRIFENGDEGMEIEVIN
jgi:RND family efflux transporter MFP subunit